MNRSPEFGMMTISLINPLEDRRWQELIERHPCASVFHTRGWLEALQRTYGYQPFILTASGESAELKGGIAFCRVSSWLTGSRLVSVPFSDHCQPLVDDYSELKLFTEWARNYIDRENWRYAEFRPLTGASEQFSGLAASEAFWHHQLDLSPSLDKLFENLHHDSVQRKIRRAEREHLEYQAGCTTEFIDAFYRLQVATRRRHHLPPQPRAWFANLAECMKGKMQIRLTRKDGSAIAAIVTLQHRATVVYKYGCSDEQFHNLGGMPFLFWKMIEESKAAGIEAVDFGRSDVDQQGLIDFKDRFGTTRKNLTYYRYSRGQKSLPLASAKSSRLQHVFSILPDSLLTAAGNLLYRHLG